MKLSNPKSRYDLKIKRTETVLEVGCGSEPHPRSNVVTDKFIDSDYHRSAGIQLYAGQTFVECDGEDLPFGDKEFDYAICNHVLEHVENPHKFLSELSRVAKRGYIETPSIIGEHLHPKNSHKWVVLEIENKLVLFDKQEINFNTRFDFGPLFLEYLLKHSLAYKVFDRQFPHLRKVQYEWVNEVTCITNPSNRRLRTYLDTWEERHIESIIPNRSRMQDAIGVAASMFSLLRHRVSRSFYGKKHHLLLPMKPKNLEKESEQDFHTTEAVWPY